MLSVIFMSFFLTLFFGLLDYYTVIVGLYILMMVTTSVTSFAPWGSFSGVLGVDGMGYALLLLTIFITVLGTLSSYSIIKSDSSKIFMVLVLVLLNFLLLSFSVSNLLVFYVFFEASLIPLVVIVVGYGNQPEKVGAGLYMLFYTVFGSLPLLLGLILVGDGGHSLNFGYLSNSGYCLELLFFPLVFLAFLIKLPAYFVHLWLPKAHVEAPVFGSMILAGIMLKLGCYGMIRFLPFFVVSMVSWLDFLVSFSLVGGVLVSLVCLAQGDLKSLVAYSSVGHMMMFMGGLLSMSWYGWVGGLVMMIAHGLTSSGMFSLINMIYERVHSRSMLMVRGVLIGSPLFSLYWFILSASNMAAPPFLNLVGELCLSFGVLGMDLLLGLPLGAMFFIGGAYSIYFFALTQHGVMWENSSYFSVMNSREGYVIVLHILPLVLLLVSLEILF